MVSCKNFTKRIDKINILNASIAMHKSIKKINHKIDLLLIDGNQFKHFKKLNINVYQGRCNI